MQTAAKYQPSSDRRVLIGLGSQDLVAKPEIRQPRGHKLTLPQVEAGRISVVRESGE
ncbi:MAG: hypothetical protein H7Y20_02565 [Bryobacteraceae bacterium]|nr:hypothetical protein [Bryobacteraceae bacterium]